MTTSLRESPFLYDIKVFNSDSGSLMGRVIDIKKTGMTIAATDKLNLHEVVHFALEDAFEIIPTKRMKVDAVCENCTEDKDYKGVYDIDVRFEEVSDDLNEMIGALSD